MRRTFAGLLLAVLLIVTPAPTTIQAATPPDTAPKVNAVLFWSNGCPACATVLQETLPPLQETYRGRLFVKLVELFTLEDIDQFYTLGQSFGFEKERINVPLLLIDSLMLIGADEIQAKLPGLVVQYIAEGGVADPDLPALESLLQSSEPFSDFDPSRLVAVEEPLYNGLGLGWGIMVGMFLALGLVIVAMLQAFQGKPLPPLKSWLNWAIPVLTVIGLGVAIYLTYIDSTSRQAICGPVGDCNAVQSSPYAKLFGFLPVGLLGAVGYVGILAAWLWQRFRSDGLARLAGSAMFAMALFGTVFSIYLTYLELLVILAVCIWCLASAVIITLLMLFNLPAATAWIAVSDETED